MHSLRLTTLSLAALVGATVATAEVSLVSFGGDYVTANQNSAATLVDSLDSPSAGNSIRRIGGFTTSANPTIGANYTGPAFFGGAQAVKLGINTANGSATASVVQDAAGDYISLNSGVPTGSLTGSSINQVVVFDIADTTYGNLTAFSSKTAGGMVTSSTTRFLIQTGGNYYLSSTNITGGFGGATWSISNLATEQWALFTPSTDWRGDYGSLSYNQTVSSSAIIETAGLFTTRVLTATAAGTTTAALTVREFNVTAAAIPEPSAFAVIAGLATLGLAATRRRRA